MNRAQREAWSEREKDEDELQTLWDGPVAFAPRAVTRTRSFSASPNWPECVAVIGAAWVWAWVWAWVCARVLRASVRVRVIST